MIETIKMIETFRKIALNKIYSDYNKWTRSKVRKSKSRSRLKKSK